MTRIAIAAALVVAVGGSLTALAQQNYPNRPVRVIVPFPPGPNDTVSRVYAQKLSEQLGKSFFVENRVGATGTIGADLVAKAPPDGYTILSTVDLPIVKAPHLVTMAFDPIKDLAPIAVVGEEFNVITVHAMTGIKSLAELIAAAKAKPGTINYASAGAGSPGHLCAEMLKMAAGINITHVPYKGAGPAMAAILQAEVPLFCGPVSALAPHVRKGTLVALAGTGEKPSAALPEIEVMARTQPDFVVTTWHAFFAPAGTAAPIIDLLKRELRKAHDDPDLIQKLEPLGREIKWLDGAEMAALIARDFAKWGRVVRQAGIKAE